MSHNITVEGGKSIRLKTAGKYCDRDIVVTATGGGSVETCNVTIVQSWGMNDDPLLLTLYVPYYNIETNGSITYGYEEFTSQNDYEPQHSVTFTAMKNIPINIFAYGFSGTISCTPSSSGGTIEAVHQAEEERLYRLIPTENTATFTFASA